MLIAETTYDPFRMEHGPFEAEGPAVPSVRFAPVGVFDLTAAVALEGAISRLSSSVRVVLDFAGVSRVEDRALLCVARALERLPHAASELTGLTLHHRSVIQYLLAR